MAKKIAVFLAEGFEEIEALTPVDLCRRAGIEVTCVSITGKKEVKGARNISVLADALLAEIDWSSFDMLVLPGGMPGTKNLEACTELTDHVCAHAAAGHYIAAICAAPTIFGKLGLLEGKAACCYPGMEADLKGAIANTQKVNVAGNIITSRGMGTAAAFALAIVEVLLDKKTADALAASVVYEA